MRIKAFLPYPVDRVPGQRYRIEQWARQLRHRGIEISYSSFLDAATMRILHQRGWVAAKVRGIAAGLARTARETRNLSGFDAAYVYREATLVPGQWIERAVARRLPVVFDFDDAIYLRDVSAANRSFAWLKSPAKAGALCRLASTVIVGSRHLAAFATRHNPSTTVIPSSIDTAQYRPAPVRPVSAPAVIGWMGSSTTQPYLESFAPTLRALSARRRIEVRVVSDRAPHLDGVPFQWRPWSAEREATEINEFDVGIMPLPDTPWTRGKCAMKALQYMGMAVPVVCSPVGANCEVVRHGENGLLAATEPQWIEAIEALLDDEQLRVRVGQAGRRSVEQRYSTDVCASRLEAVLRSVISARAVANVAPASQVS